MSTWAASKSRRVDDRGRGWNVGLADKRSRTTFSAKLHVHFWISLRLVNSPTSHPYYAHQSYLSKRSRIFSVCTASNLGAFVTTIMASPLDRQRSRKSSSPGRGVILVDISR